jgi:hypothetical protein
MKKEIKFSLVYRDMFQSSGKFQPLAEQLEKIAPVIVEMGCFARVETNGGAFEQVNLMAGENPNKAVRSFTKYFHEAGIQTQGQNLPITIIEDGHLFRENLPLLKKDEAWVQRILRKHHADQKSTWLLTADADDNILFLKKEAMP